MTAIATTWNPPVGRLIFWTLTYGESTEAILGVASEPANEHGITKYESIAELRYGEGKPCFCGWVNMARTAEDRTGAGGRIVQRLATDEDIAAVVRAWSGRYSLDAWIEDIEATGARVIDADELQRLRRVVAEVMAEREKSK